MNYKDWLNTFLDACNEGMAIPFYQWATDDFPTINLKIFYQQGFTPERAATIAKAINHFTKPKYFSKKKSPIHLSFGGKM